MIAYFILAWYLDAVIPNVYGRRKNPFFFLIPFSWRPWSTRRRSLHFRDASGEAAGDIDLMREHQNACDMNQSYAIRIVNLKKVYPGKTIAVNELFLTLMEGNLQVNDGNIFKFADFNAKIYRLSLLGQNGAGKSTLQNILAGGIEVTSGDAYIFDQSVRTNMGSIRMKMGVCPQVISPSSSVF